MVCVQPLGVVVVLDATDLVEVVAALEDEEDPVLAPVLTRVSTPGIHGKRL